MIIPDPLDPERTALDEDGELLSPVRMLPIREGEPPPTAAELDQAPIVGWSRGLEVFAKGLYEEDE